MYQPTFGRYTAKMNEFLSDSAVGIYVCEKDGIKAGILILDCSGEAPEIVGIAVSESCRGCGIGQYLVRRVMQAEHVRRISAQTDDDAIGFYRKCGFRDEKTTEEYQNGTVVRYHCTLTSKATHGA